MSNDKYKSYCLILVPVKNNVVVTLYLRCVMTLTMHSKASTLNFKLLINIHCSCLT